MIKPILNKIVGSDGIGVFHDSRKDVRTLSRIINELIDKVNELVKENNRLSRIVAAQECDATGDDSSTGDGQQK